MAQAQNKILHMRLVEEVDAEMREFVSRRGDLSELILGMVKNVDLESVKIVKVVLCETGKRRPYLIFRIKIMPI